MIVLKNGTVRLTPAELNRLRTYAARNGVAVNDVRTVDELLTASLAALSDKRQRELLEFLEKESLAKQKDEAADEI